MREPAVWRNLNYTLYRNFNFSSTRYWKTLPKIDIIAKFGISLQKQTFNASHYKEKKQDNRTTQTVLSNKLAV